MEADAAIAAGGARRGIKRRRFAPGIKGSFFSPEKRAFPLQRVTSLKGNFLTRQRKRAIGSN